jgi:hypothetical protein
MMPISLAAAGSLQLFPLRSGGVEGAVEGADRAGRQGQQ